MTRPALKLVDANLCGSSRVVRSERIHTGFLVIENTQHVAVVVKAIRERWKREAGFVLGKEALVPVGGE